MFKIIFLILWSAAAYSQCPVKGDGSARLWHIDSAKNIQQCADTSFAAIETIQCIMKDSLTAGEFVSIDCFIVSAKLSGVESCQCHDKNVDMLDYHIYVSDKPAALKKDCGIIEVTRYSRIFNSALSLANIKKMIGKKVRVFGYVFSDEEHKSAIGNWRSGIEEIHPVFYIEKL
jgi:WD40 repeat protein